MTRYFNTALIAAALGACVFSAPATAQVICVDPGTENVAGTCMTRGLAASMRLRSTCLNQVKIAYNGCPTPPRFDDAKVRTFDLNRFEYSQPGNFSTNPFPPSP
jgi:hypothetical protein